MDAQDFFRACGKENGGRRQKLRCMSGSRGFATSIPRLCNLSLASLASAFRHPFFRHISPTLFAFSSFYPLHHSHPSPIKLSVYHRFYSALYLSLGPEKSTQNFEPSPCHCQHPCSTIPWTSLTTPIFLSPRHLGQS
jgi:hypothetical protein